jgi:hypothetical protein
MAALVTTVIFDRDLYKPGHLVHRWVTLVTERFVGHAIDLAPKRTGELAAGIRGATNQVGPRQVEGLISSSAPHTMYVLRGTTGPIMSRRAFANPEGAFSQLWGSIDPRTGKFTRRRVKGAERTIHSVPNKGYFLYVPSSEYGPGGPRLSVHGQEANNFLLAAWRRTAINHKAIRGKVPSWLLNP